ncbi:hypothetical protein BB560_002847 [Smittium megazygosporum]|uniref:Uncharacterized protein n=1 Tax=Smittium megazygosporum TaxID=133381 RepID=A0A2T9ZDP1_9FUNG|nr:hypothetical protein BB560_002847 [Smittium megazygosporum]
MNRSKNKTRIIAKRISSLEGIEYLIVNSPNVRPSWTTIEDGSYKLELFDFEEELAVERQKYKNVDIVDPSNAGICCLLKEAREFLVNDRAFDDSRFLTDLACYKRKLYSDFKPTKTSQFITPIRVLEKLIDSSGKVHYNVLFSDGVDKWLNIEQLEDCLPLIDKFEFNLDAKKLSLPWLNRPQSDSKSSDKPPSSTNRDSTLKASTSASKLNQNQHFIKPASSSLNNIQTQGPPISQDPSRRVIPGGPPITVAIAGSSANISSPNKTSIPANMYNDSRIRFQNQSLQPAPNSPATSLNKPKGISGASNISKDSSAVNANIPEEPEWGNFDISIPLNSSELTTYKNPSLKNTKKYALNQTLKSFEAEAKPLKPPEPNKNIPEPVMLRGTIPDTSHKRSAAMTSLVNQYAKARAGPNPLLAFKKPSSASTNSGIPQIKIAGSSKPDLAAKDKNARIQNTSPLTNTSKPSPKNSFDNRNKGVHSLKPSRTNRLGTFELPKPSTDKNSYEKSIPTVNKGEKSAKIPLVQSKSNQQQISSPSKPKQGELLKSFLMPKKVDQPSKPTPASSKTEQNKTESFSQVQKKSQQKPTQAPTTSSWGAKNLVLKRKEQIPNDKSAVENTSVGKEKSIIPPATPQTKPKKDLAFFLNSSAKSLEDIPKKSQSVSDSTEIKSQNIIKSDDNSAEQSENKSLSTAQSQASQIYSQSDSEVVSSSYDHESIVSISEGVVSFSAVSKPISKTLSVSDSLISRELEIKNAPILSNTDKNEENANRNKSYNPGQGKIANPEVKSIISSDSVMVDASSADMLSSDESMPLDSELEMISSNTQNIHSDRNISKLKPIIFIGYEDQKKKLNLSFYSNFSLQNDVDMNSYEESSESDVELLSGSVLDTPRKIKKTETKSGFKHSRPQKYSRSRAIYSDSSESESDELLSGVVSVQSSSSGFHDPKTAKNSTTKFFLTDNKRNLKLKDSDESDYDPDIYQNGNLYDRIKSSRTSRRGNFFKSVRRGRSINTATIPRSNIPNRTSNNKRKLYNSDSESDVIRAKDIVDSSFSDSEPYSNFEINTSKHPNSNYDTHASCSFCSISGTLNGSGINWVDENLKRCNFCGLVSHKKCISNFLNKFSISAFENSQPISENSYKDNIQDMERLDSWRCIFCQTFFYKIKKIIAYRELTLNKLTKNEHTDKDKVPLVTDSLDTIDILLDEPDIEITTTTNGKNDTSFESNNPAASENVSGKNTTENSVEKEKPSNQSHLSKNPLPKQATLNSTTPDIHSWDDKEMLVLLDGHSYRNLSWIPALYVRIISSQKFKLATKVVYQYSQQKRDLFIHPSYTEADYFMGFQSCDGNEINNRKSQLQQISDKNVPDSMSVQQFENLYISVYKIYVKWKGLQVSESTYDEPPHPYSEQPEYLLWLEEWNRFQHSRKVSAMTAQAYFLSFEKSISLKEKIGGNSKEVDFNPSRKAIPLGKNASLELNKLEKPSSSNKDGAGSRRLSNWVSSVFKEVQSQPSYIKYGKLYPYQLEGINWLLYKWVENQSCILADEMGLGKTIQIVCFLSILARLMSPNASNAEMKSKFARNQLIFPFLIVVPNSVIDNWIREFRNWAPEMVVVAFNGSKESREILANHLLFRQSSADIGSGLDLQCHAVVTSYETIINVKALHVLQRFKGAWQCMIIDEGHRLKNDSSKSFLTLQELNCRHRILLTGTPLQNNIREVINLMNFIQPEKFANAVELEKTYENANEEQLRELRSLLQPHILRRLRDQVLRDLLPSKHEIIVPVSLTAWQRELYRATLKKNVRALEIIRKFFEKNGKDSNPKHSSKSISLNNVLIQIRKIIDHPYNMEFNTPSFESQEDAQKHLVQASGKFQLLDLLVHELKRRGRRLLIFSQFIDMLDNFEDYFARENLGYLRLDGNTPQHLRQQMVDLFNENPDKYFVFLVSTRAGGSGLNLYGADTVIIYSPDWNPHMDNQALSRAYRIGQKKPVLVIRLMTKNSAEERIIQAGNKKLFMDKVLIESVNEEDNSGVTEKDLASAIRCGAEDLFEEQEQNAEAKMIRYDEAKVRALVEECEHSLRLADESRKNSAGADSTAKEKNIFSFARIWDVTQNAEKEMDTNVDDYNSAFAWVDSLNSELQKSSEISKEQLGRGFRHKNRVVYYDTLDNSNNSKIPNKKKKASRSSATHSSDDEFIPYVAREISSDGSSKSTDSALKPKPKLQNPLTSNEKIAPRYQPTVDKAEYTRLMASNQPLSDAFFYNSVYPETELASLFQMDRPRLTTALFIKAFEIGYARNLPQIYKKAIELNYFPDLQYTVSLFVELASNMGYRFHMAAYHLSIYLLGFCEDACRLGPRTENSGLLHKSVASLLAHFRGLNRSSVQGMVFPEAGTSSGLNNGPTTENSQVSLVQGPNIQPTPDNTNAPVSNHPRNHQDSLQYKQTNEPTRVQEQQKPSVKILEQPKPSSTDINHTEGVEDTQTIPNNIAQDNQSEKTILESGLSSSNSFESSVVKDPNPQQPQSSPVSHINNSLSANAAFSSDSTTKGPLIIVLDEPGELISQQDNSKEHGSNTSEQLQQNISQNVPLNLQGSSTLQEEQNPIKPDGGTDNDSSQGSPHLDPKNAQEVNKPVDAENPSDKSNSKADEDPSNVIVPKSDNPEQTKMVLDAESKLNTFLTNIDVIQATGKSDTSKGTGTPGFTSQTSIPGPSNIDPQNPTSSEQVNYGVVGLTEKTVVLDQENQVQSENNVYSNIVNEQADLPKTPSQESALLGTNSNLSVELTPINQLSLAQSSSTVEPNPEIPNSGSIISEGAITVQAPEPSDSIANTPNIATRVPSNVTIKDTLQENLNTSQNVLPPGSLPVNEVSEANSLSRTTPDPDVNLPNATSQQSSSKLIFSELSTFNFLEPANPEANRLIRITVKIILETIKSASSNISADELEAVFDKIIKVILHSCEQLLSLVSARLEAPIDIFNQIKDSNQLTEEIQKVLNEIKQSLVQSGNVDILSQNKYSPIILLPQFYFFISFFKHTIVVSKCKEFQLFKKWYFRQLVNFKRLNPTLDITLRPSQSENPCSKPSSNNNSAQSKVQPINHLPTDHNKSLSNAPDSRQTITNTYNPSQMPPNMPNTTPFPQVPNVTRLQNNLGSLQYSGLASGGSSSLNINTISRNNQNPSQANAQTNYQFVRYNNQTAPLNIPKPSLPRPQYPQRMVANMSSGNDTNQRIQYTNQSAFSTQGNVYTSRTPVNETNVAYNQRSSSTTFARNSNTEFRNIAQNTNMNIISNNMNHASSQSSNPTEQSQQGSSSTIVLPNQIQKQISELMQTTIRDYFSKFQNQMDKQIESKINAKIETSIKDKISTQLEGSLTLPTNFSVSETNPNLDLVNPPRLPFEMRGQPSARHSSPINPYSGTEFSSYIHPTNSYGNQPSQPGVPQINTGISRASTSLNIGNLNPVTPNSIASFSGQGSTHFINENETFSTPMSVHSSINSQNINLFSLINDCPLCGNDQPSHLASECPYKYDKEGLMRRRQTILNKEDVPQNLKDLIIPKITDQINRL